jgi:hypothetical protein
MDTERFSQQLERATYMIEAFDNGENFSSGSGVAINGRGDLLTAAHVVTNRLPVRDEDVQDPGLKLIAKTKEGVFIEYKPVLCGLQVENEYLSQPLTVDVALLRSTFPRVDVAHIPISPNAISLGQSTLIAGFPDEMELPFRFDRAIDRMHPELREERQEIRERLETLKRLLMIKRAMIGNFQNFTFRSDDAEIRGKAFYLDNAMHSGASGGPVLNANGEIVGIITKRAVTDASTEEIDELEVPSGSTVAATPRFLLPLL